MQGINIGLTVWAVFLRLFLWLDEVKKTSRQQARFPSCSPRTTRVLTANQIAPNLHKFRFVIGITKLSLTISGMSEYCASILVAMTLGQEKELFGSQVHPWVGML